MCVLCVNDTHQRRFAQIVAVILLREQPRKAPMLVRSFWDVKATQDIDLPRTQDKAPTFDRVTEIVVVGLC